MEEDKTCVDCKYYLDDYWNCQGQEKVCHEFIEAKNEEEL